MPMPTAGTMADADRLTMEDAIVEVRVAFAHEGLQILDSLIRLARLTRAHSTHRKASRVLEDIVEQDPRLEAEAARLAEDHETLPDQLDQLVQRVRALLEDAAAVCDRIVEHHRLGDHLVYEAFMSDLGGGD
ncbi:MAG TPA: hypothetical protein VK011_01025 [Acidimicrobiia bacterium]|nr:hypothetical protein [Acidimicrobiia bacterium]